MEEGQGQGGEGELQGEAGAQALPGAGVAGASLRHLGVRPQERSLRGVLQGEGGQEGGPPPPGYYTLLKGSPKTLYHYTSLYFVHKKTLF